MTVAIYDARGARVATLFNVTVLPAPILWIGMGGLTTPLSRRLVCALRASHHQPESGVIK